MDVRAFPGFNFPVALKEAREPSRTFVLPLERAEGNPKTKARPAKVFS
jgi:hypothetical protein